MDTATATDAGADTFVEPDAGPPCSGASVCHLPGGATALGDCVGGTTAACAPTGIVDCACAPAAPVRMFFDPRSSSGGRLEHVIVVAAAGIADLTLQIDGLCAGGGGGVTCLIDGPCPELAPGTRAWVWTLGPTLGGRDLTTRGPHPVRIFRDDLGAPCDSAPEAIAADFVIP